MSQVNTQQMGRLVAAGSKDRLDEAIEILARLEALHIIDYDGGEEGFSLGSPNPKSESVSRDLVKARAAASIVEASGPDSPIPAAPVRNALEERLPSKIDSLLADSARVDDLENDISSLSEEEEGLSMVAPLGIDIELLGGFDSLASFVGTVDSIADAKEAASAGLFFEGKNGIVAIFVRSEAQASTSTALEKAGFESIQIPEGEGSAEQRLTEVRKAKGSLQGEKLDLDARIDDWKNANGQDLVCGLEVLERDHDVLTAPVRVAVSEHAFLIDGWIVLERSEEVLSALSDVCIHSEVAPFKMEAGGGGHGIRTGDHGSWATSDQSLRN